MIKCKVPQCDEDASVFIVDHGTLAAPRRWLPGDLIECDDPKTIEGYCDWCWSMNTVLFSTPAMRWPEGAEL